MESKFTSLRLTVTIIKYNLFSIFLSIPGIIFWLKFTGKEIRIKHEMLMKEVFSGTLSFASKVNE